ncbi:ribosome assembly factor SBDS, partial [Candidatus Woesearchaeota archaeon]|nr:ribosome assembly factor SBDS [Candidatus Woesearchaeota archaeon]
EKVKLILTIPSKYSGSTYSALRNKMNKFSKEEWLSNGDLKIEIEVTGGQKTDIYTLINKLTNGEAIIEE